MKKKVKKREGFLSGYDYNGSYTGNNFGCDRDLPVQDVDDL